MTPLVPGLLQRDGITLVFGMEWFPMLGDQLSTQARALARRRRAGHYVITSGAADSVGLLCAGTVSRGGTRRCSAAAIFAAMHPCGTVASILPLPNGTVWMVAVHEGAVMAHSDQMHDDIDHALQSISVLREAHPGLLLQDESHDSNGLLDALFAAAPQVGQLQAMSLWGRRPVAVTLALLLIVTALVLGPARQLLTGMGSAADVPAVDPAQAWKEAIARSAQRHSVHGVAGLQAVVDALHAAPIFLAGWRLVQAECKPGTGMWLCRARYRREGDADNQGLINAAFPGWALAFDPMDGADASWSVGMPSLPLTSVPLRAPEDNQRRLFSALQAMLPAFAEFRLEMPQPLRLTPPVDSQQRPVPRPSGLVAHQRRAIHLQAPLWSLSLLMPETVHMSWDRVVLQLGMVDQPTLRNSSLRVSLSGVLYETDGYSDSASLALGTEHGIHDGRPG